MNTNLARLFGERLKKLRISKGMNALDISEQVGIHRSTYSGYETQERFAPPETLAKLAVVLGTSSDYLLGITDDPTPKETTLNLREYLTYKNLHWDGIPLSENDIKTFENLFKLLIQERIKHRETEETPSQTDEAEQFCYI